MPFLLRLFYEAVYESPGALGDFLGVKYWPEIKHPERYLLPQLSDGNSSIIKLGAAPLPEEIFWLFELLFVNKKTERFFNCSLQSLCRLKQKKDKTVLCTSSAPSLFFPHQSTCFYCSLNMLFPCILHRTVAGNVVKKYPALYRLQLIGKAREKFSLPTSCMKHESREIGLLFWRCIQLKIYAAINNKENLTGHKRLLILFESIEDSDPHRRKFHPHSQWRNIAAFENHNRNPAYRCIAQTRSHIPWPGSGHIWHTRHSWWGRSWPHTAAMDRWFHMDCIGAYSPVSPYRAR